MPTPHAFLPTPTIAQPTIPLLPTLATLPLTPQQTAAGPPTLPAITPNHWDPATAPRVARQYNLGNRTPAPPAVSQDKANHVATISPAAPLFPQTTDYLLQAHVVLHPETGVAMEYRTLSTDPATKTTWVRSFANELGHLAQGVGDRIKGTDTIFFVPFSAVPKDRTVTYGCIVCNYRPQKAEAERMRLRVWGATSFCIRLMSAPTRLTSSRPNLSLTVPSPHWALGNYSLTSKTTI
jgi:hypothetical protein